MTTRRAAEAVLFDVETSTRVDNPERSDNWIAEDLGVNDETVTAKRQGLEEAGQLPETGSSLGKDGKERRRLSATYCPRCGGWVEVRLRPVRLSCTRCGLEARP